MVQSLCISSLDPWVLLLHRLSSLCLRFMEKADASDAFGGTQLLRSICFGYSTGACNFRASCELIMSLICPNCLARPNFHTKGVLWRD